jgi:hypothetical protein
MEDAWVSPNSVLSVTIPASGPVYIAAYFQELDANASAINVRGMTFYLNNNQIQSFNSSDKPSEIITTADVNGLTVNMSLVQTKWSSLRPILNAYELYSIGVFNSSRTADEDGERIVQRLM